MIWITCWASLASMRQQSQQRRKRRRRGKTTMMPRRKRGVEAELPKRRRKRRAKRKLREEENPMLPKIGSKWIHPGTKKQPAITKRVVAPWTWQPCLNPRVPNPPKRRQRRLRQPRRRRRRRPRRQRRQRRRRRNRRRRIRTSTRDSADDGLHMGDDMHMYSIVGEMQTLRHLPSVLWGWELAAFDYFGGAMKEVYMCMYWGNKSKQKCNIDKTNFVG
mmetsp:Transcript_29495/g.50217  ORF Transcript_29495/g.50217 Transcript_29495/m.50217 type:complete len:218 (-) Transcript_29495:43-696(-)